MKTCVRKKRKIGYKIFKFCVKIFYHSTRFLGKENLPNKPCVIVANHAQIHGPLAVELQFPREKYIWMTGEMAHFKGIPAYAMNDFWGYKKGVKRAFYKCLSYLCAPFFAFVHKNANIIDVYKDARVIKTFKNTVSALKDGADVVIFPESRELNNEFINKFYEHFVDVARVYYKATGEELTFVPMYNAPKLKVSIFGKPITYDHNQPAEKQREDICGYLSGEITRLGKNLPKHKIVPYDNVGRKNYKYSK
jgi:hypothetical protein